MDVTDLSQDTLSDALIKDAVTVSSNSFDFRRAAKYAMNLDLNENKDLVPRPITATSPMTMAMGFSTAPQTATPPCSKCWKFKIWI